MELKEYIVKALAEYAGDDIKEVTFDISVYAIDQKVYVSEAGDNRIKFTVVVGRRETE
jgi:hypothetical protein